MMSRIGSSLLPFLLLLCGEALLPSLAFQQQATAPRPTTRRKSYSYSSSSAPASSTTTRLYAIDSVSTRRAFFANAAYAASGLATGASLLPQPAHAGLMQFPCTRPLKNRYHFMRAGPSELEAEGVYSTNPLFLTNRENALQTNSKAHRIVLEACATIKSSENFPTVAYHSLAANGMDTADLMATELRISRDRLLPEFTYLDQRGVGLWDSMAMDDVKPAIVALDYLEGGKEGTGGRPPANEDGTPNETLADQFVRLRQFLSLQESRTSGENILIIFPDGTGPALLSSMIAGIPLNEAHCLDYAPGEVRLDITRDSILEQYALKKEDPDYLALLETGKEKLAMLRDQKDIVSLKDQKQEQERAAFESDFARKKAQEREQERLQQQAKKEEAARLAQEKREQKEAAAALAAANKGQSADTSESPVMVAAVSLGVVGAGMAAFLGNSAEPPAAPPVQRKQEDLPVTPTSNLIVGANGTATISFAAPIVFHDDADDIVQPSADSSSSSIDEELTKLEAAQDAMYGTLKENTNDMSTTTPLGGSSQPKATEEQPEQLDNKVEAAQEAINGFYNTFDDGASDWLQVLAEIRDEPDEESDRINGEERASASSIRGYEL